MGYFKNRKKKAGLSEFDYENASISELEERLVELQYEIDNIKSLNGIRLGSLSIVAMFAMLGVLTLTASFPIWASIILTFLSPLAIVPINFKGVKKELKLKMELENLKDKLEQAYIEEEANEHVERITVDAPTITFGSESFKNLMEELGGDKELVASEDINLEELIPQSSNSEDNDVTL